MAIYVTHDEAVDLAIDALDFTLSDIEKEALDGHVDSCSTCRDEIDRIREDDSLIETSIEWQDEFGDSSGDEFAFTESDEGDENAVADPDEDDEFSGGAGRDEGEMRLPKDARTKPDDEDAAGEPRDKPEDDLEDELDLDASGVEDETTFGGEGSDIEEDSDDETPVAADSDEPDADDPATRAAEEAAERAAEEAERKAEEVAAQAEADKMSDEELAETDSDKHEDDGLYPDCAADGVEQAAQMHGAYFDDYKRKEAERSIRDDEGIEKTDHGKVAVYKSTVGITTRSYNDRPEISGHAAAAIRNAILRSRTGTTGVERYQKRGKLDGKSLQRLAMQDTRIFKRSIAPDPGKFLIWVMVDVSGSMGGSPVSDAATVARALADASMGTPTVRLEVWAWSDPFMRRHAYDVGARAGVVRVWNRHLPTTEVFKLAQLPMGGTPDAPVLDWAWRAILKETHQGETPAIIMCSDGWGDYQMPQVIDKARKHGVMVKSVALGYLNERQQEQRFGRGNYVPWQGSISATARPLANMILDIATGRGERP